jgi:hypothetical protein
VYRRERSTWSPEKAKKKLRACSCTARRRRVKHLPGSVRSVLGFIFQHGSFVPEIEREMSTYTHSHAAAGSPASLHGKQTPKLAQSPVSSKDKAQSRKNGDASSNT